MTKNLNDRFLQILGDNINKKAVPIAVLLLTLIAFAPAQASPSEQSNEETLEVTLFYSETCPHCEKVEGHLSDLKEDYPIEVNKYKAADNSSLFVEYLSSYNVPQNKWGGVPTLFVEDSNEYCMGDSPCIELLNNQVESIGEDGGTSNSGGRTSDLTLSGILALAGADAVNPCALAVLLILLTSILTKYPKKKNKALLSGILFSLAVLICYFALGALIIFGFKSVASISSIGSSLIYKILGVIAILIGLFNMKDWLSYGAGGFVIEVPISWRPKMKRFINSITSPTGAFLIGIIVSLFLLPCTSGPYFVAGGLLSDLGWSSALPWLLLYNLIFILPMVGITLFIYGGFASVEEISDWRERNIERLHLVTGLILIGLGIYVLSVGFGLL